VSGASAQEVSPQPNEAQLKAGLEAGIRDSHFAPPIEVSDIFRSPSSYLEPWMLCIRSGLGSGPTHYLLGPLRDQC
jgi:hypothetical protein